MKGCVFTIILYAFALVLNSFYYKVAPRFIVAIAATTTGLLIHTIQWQPVDFFLFFSVAVPITFFIVLRDFMSFYIFDTRLWEISRVLFHWALS